MKVPIILIIFLFFYNLECHAQFSFGFDFGFDINHLNTDISNRQYTIIQNKEGICYNYIFEYRFNSHIEIKSGIGEIFKNYQQQRTEQYEGAYENHINSYLHMPVIVKFKIFNVHKTRTIFNFGCFGSFWRYCYLYGTLPNIFDSTSEIGKDGVIVQNFKYNSFAQKYHFIKSKDNRFEAGIVTGFTFEYGFQEGNNIYLEANLIHSMTDQQKKYMILQNFKKNKTFSFSIGYKIAITRKNE